MNYVVDVSPATNQTEMSVVTTSEVQSRKGNFAKARAMIEMSNGKFILIEKEIESDVEGTGCLIKVALSYRSTEREEFLEGDLIKHDNPDKSCLYPGKLTLKRSKPQKQVFLQIHD